MSSYLLSLISVIIFAIISAPIIIIFGNFELIKKALKSINNTLNRGLGFINTNKNFITHAMDDAKITHVNNSSLVQNEWGRSQANQFIAWLTCGALTIKQAAGKPFFLLNLYVLGGLNYRLQRAHMDELQRPVIPEIKKSVGSLFKRKQVDPYSAPPAAPIASSS